jgi:hypothetical protein
MTAAATRSSSADVRQPLVPRSYLLALSTSALLGVLLIPSRGHYRADSMVFVFAALGLVLWQLVDLAKGRWREMGTTKIGHGVVLVLAVFAVSTAIDAKLLIGVERSWWSLRALAIVELGLLLSYLRDARILPRSRWPELRFALFAACIALSATEVVRISPAPTIDVWTVQMDGAHAVLAGKNPFEAVAVVDTAPDVLRDDVPYVYPPFQLLATLPAALLGDIRYTMSAALVLLGIALRDLTRRSGRSLPPILLDAPALVVWLSPKVLFILQQAWVDPVQIALIAISIALAVRKRTWAAAIGFGLVLAAKQTMFWVAPLAFVTFPIFRPRHALVAVAIPIATYVPFALWNWPALLHANLGFVAGLPPRPDALSFVNWAGKVLGVHIPYALAFPLAGSIVAFVVLRRRAQPHILGVALLITYFFFFTLNKWTFANYYFSLLGLAALGAALSIHRKGSGEPGPVV